MPNGRHHDDLDNRAPVLSTIETWRQPESRSRARGRRTSSSATGTSQPDCMGRWVVYWRQNMPGLDNTALDDDGLQ